jgi:hypothetical protein
MLVVPMEKLLYTKTPDTILVDTLNNAPDLDFNINDTSIFTGILYEYTIPEDLFYDKDGDELTLSVKQNNGSELPDWLDYNSSNKKFSGTPVETGAYYIMVTASDSAGAERADVFKIDVTTQTGTKDLDLERVIICPNPIDNSLKLKIDNPFEQIVFYKIIDCSGKIIQEDKINPDNTINVSSIKKGIYFLKLKLDHKETVKKLIIN